MRGTRRGCDLFRFSDPAEGHELVEISDRAAGALHARFQHWRVDFAGADSVDADFVRSVVSGEILREARNCRLCYIIGDVVRRRIKAPLRRGVDDRTAASLDHVRKSRLAQMEHGIDIDGKAQSPVFRRQRQEIATTVDAGIVARHIDPALMRHDILNHGTAALSYGDVARQCTSSSSLAGDLGYGHLGAFAVHVGDDHLGTFRSKGVRTRAVRNRTLRLNEA